MGGDKILLIGGYEGEVWKPLIDQYNVKNDMWEEESDLPQLPFTMKQHKSLVINVGCTVLK